MWTDIATRFKYDPWVIGADLRNELRQTTIGGVKLIPVWGTGVARLDWRLEAEKVGNMVLDVNPNMIIFVEGLQYANRFPVRARAVNLTVPNKLIYYDISMIGT
eukprot:UN18555